MDLGNRRPEALLPTIRIAVQPIGKAVVGRLRGRTGAETPFVAGQLDDPLLPVDGALPLSIPADSAELLEGRRLQLR